MAERPANNDTCTDCPYRDAAWQLNADPQRRSPGGARSWPGWARVLILMACVTVFSQTVFFFCAPGAAAQSSPGSKAPERVCAQCQFHTRLADAVYCRRCGARLSALHLVSAAR